MKVDQVPRDRLRRVPPITVTVHTQAFPKEERETFLSLKPNRVSSWSF